jgi:membrane protein required for beta-lactamase induction
MAAFMAILIAALLDAGKDYIPGGQKIAQWRNPTWVPVYNSKILELLTRFKIVQPYLVLALLFLPLCIAVLLMKLIFVAVLSIVGNIIVMALVLWYCMGNNEAATQQSPFVEAHERSFGVLFWFILLGPIGAVFYWFLVINLKNEALGNAVTTLHTLAAWVPARITGFIYALVGNFSTAFKNWMTSISNVALPSSQLLVDCGSAAVDTADSADGVNLIFRAYIAWVVFGMILVLFL